MDVCPRCRGRICWGSCSCIQPKKQYHACLPQHRKLPRPKFQALTSFCSPVYLWLVFFQKFETTSKKLIKVHLKGIPQIHKLLTFLTDFEIFKIKMDKNLKCNLFSQKLPCAKAIKMLQGNSVTAIYRLYQKQRCQAVCFDLNLLTLNHRQAIKLLLALLWFSTDTPTY